MRFPFALSAKIAGHIIKHKSRRTPKFAMVLQLEPLHTCNLTCTGCGRIREYSTNLKDMVPLEKCLAAAVECEAPMVSICGGEPLIYPEDRGTRRRVCASKAASFTSAPTACSCGKKCAITWPRLSPTGDGTKLQELLERRTRHGKEAEASASPTTRRAAKRHPPEPMDVLERPRGRPGIHA